MQTFKIPQLLGGLRFRLLRCRHCLCLFHYSLGLFCSSSCLLRLGRWLVLVGGSTCCSLLLYVLGRIGSLCLNLFLLLVNWFYNNTRHHDFNWSFKEIGIFMSTLKCGKVVHFLEDMLSFHNNSKAWIGLFLNAVLRLSTGTMWNRIVSLVDIEIGSSRTSCESKSLSCIYSGVYESTRTRLSEYSFHNNTTTIPCLTKTTTMQSQQ